MKTSQNPLLPQVLAFSRKVWDVTEAAEAEHGHSIAISLLGSSARS